MSKLITMPKEKLPEGVIIVGVISSPGSFIREENREDKYRFRMATGGDQIHVPTFLTVTFYGDLATQVSDNQSLKKELTPIMVHGKLSANPSKDGKRAYIELNADGFITL